MSTAFDPQDESISSMPKFAAVDLPAAGEIIGFLERLCEESYLIDERIECPGCKPMNITIDPTNDVSLWVVRMSLLEDTGLGYSTHAPTLHMLFKPVGRSLHPYYYSNVRTGEELRLAWVEDSHVQVSVKWAPLMVRAAREFDGSLRDEGYVKAVADLLEEKKEIKI